MLPNDVTEFLEQIIKGMPEFYLKLKAKQLLEKYAPRAASAAGPSEFKDYSNTTPVLEWREEPWNTRH